MPFRYHLLSALTTLVHRRLQYNDTAATPQYSSCLLQRLAVIAAVVKARVVNDNIDRADLKWQVIELGLNPRPSGLIMTTCPQAIAIVNAQIDSARQMAKLCQPIAKPSDARAEIQNTQTIPKDRQNTAREKLKRTPMKFPLPCQRMSRSALRQAAIEFGIIGSAAFSEPY
jgi:hypothetical protein